MEGSLEEGRGRGAAWRQREDQARGDQAGAGAAPPARSAESCFGFVVGERGIWVRDVFFCTRLKCGMRLIFALSWLETVLAAVSLSVVPLSLCSFLNTSRRV